MACLRSYDSTGRPSDLLPAAWSSRYESHSRPTRAGGLPMKRIRHSPEQIIRKLREADAELAKGTAIPEVCKALGIAENTYYRWRNQFGGIKADEMKRLKELEKENARLKALVADLSLDKAILKEAARGNS